MLGLLLALSLAGTDDGIMCVGVPSNPRFTSVSTSTVDAGQLNVEYNATLGRAGGIVTLGGTGSGTTINIGNATATASTVNIGGNVSLNNSMACTGGATISACGAFSTATGTGGFTANTSSGSDAFKVATNGARVHFGAGASDYANSDGTTVTFAGPVTSTGVVTASVTAAAIGVNTAGYYQTTSTGTAFYMAGNGGTFLINSVLMQRTAPTVTACSGGTAASMTSNNGTAAFVFDVGTSCAGESTAVITFPAATTGWICSCSSTTADRVLQQKVIPAASTTVVTIQNIVMSTGANGDFTDGADVACLCMGN